VSNNQDLRPPQEALDALAAQLQTKNKEIVERVNDNIENKGSTEMSAVLYELAIVSMQLENITAIVLKHIDENDRPLIEVPRIGG